jgi:uncharacterized protein
MDPWLPWYLALGSGVGLAAGLLGIGGGLLLVPAMLYALGAQGLAPEDTMRVALGTSMATVVFTSAASVRAHHARGAVDWSIVQRMLPGILLGAVVGCVVSSHVPGRALVLVFALYLVYAGTQMLVSWQPAAAARLPGRAGLAVAGSVICASSSLLAVGGATLTIPFLARCNVPFRRAIGTAAAVAIPLAVASTVGYVIAGWASTRVPAASAGYVYLPAVASIAVASVALAPVGAWLSHRLPVALLRRVFALLLYAIAVKLFLSVA